MTDETKTVQEMIEYLQRIPNKNMMFMSVTGQSKWIPCSERLPEENKEVLINLAWGIDIGEYREGGWHSEWINHYDDDNVIAWMPLPEPYKGGEDK